MERNKKLCFPKHNIFGIFFNDLTFYQFIFYFDYLFFTLTICIWIISILYWPYVFAICPHYITHSDLHYLRIIFPIYIYIISRLYCPCVTAQHYIAKVHQHYLCVPLPMCICIITTLYCPQV